MMRPVTDFCHAWRALQQAARGQQMQKRSQDEYRGGFHRHWAATGDAVRLVL